jgi:hypothetical protein
MYIYIHTTACAQSLYTILNHRVSNAKVETSWNKLNTWNVWNVWNLKTSEMFLAWWRWCHRWWQWEPGRNAVAAQCTTHQLDPIGPTHSVTRWGEAWWSVLVFGSLGSDSGTTQRDQWTVATATASHQIQDTCGAVDSFTHSHRPTWRPMSTSTQAFDVCVQISKRNSLPQQ